MDKTQIQDIIINEVKNETNVFFLNQVLESIRSLRKAQPEVPEEFEAARKLFPGVKRGSKTEFDNYRKKHRDWKECLKLLKPAVEREIEHKSSLVKKKEFCPQWANFQTWINQRRWEQEFTVEKPVLSRPKVQCQICRAWVYQLYPGLTCLECFKNEKEKRERTTQISESNQRVLSL